MSSSSCSCLLFLFFLLSGNGFFFFDAFILFTESVSGQVHATDYSNASTTGIFDTYQVWCTTCLFTVFVCFWRFCLLYYCHVTFFFFFFTDVLEWGSQLSAFPASLYFSQSRKYRVSHPIPSNSK